MMGQLVQQYGKGNVYIEGKKAIVGPGDRAMPDAIGTFWHPFAPTDPSQGSHNSFMYDGNAGGGGGRMLGSLGTNPGDPDDLLKWGELLLGETVTANGQLVGIIKNFTMIGPGRAEIVLQNMTGVTPEAGQELVGTDSNCTFILSSFDRTSGFDQANTTFNYDPIMEVAVGDDGGVVAVDKYFTDKPSQDYNPDFVVIDG